MENDQGRDGDQQYVHEQQVVLRLEPALKVEQRHLDGDVLLAGQVIQRVADWGNGPLKPCCRASAGAFGRSIS